MTTKTKAIRALNDELRQNFAAGTAVMTAGVAAVPGHIRDQIAESSHRLREWNTYYEICQALASARSEVLPKPSSSASRGYINFGM
jgi:hypothetical protein